MRIRIRQVAAAVAATVIAAGGLIAGASQAGAFAGGDVSNTPWVVQVHSYAPLETEFCTGTAISDSWVMTADHCDIGSMAVDYPTGSNGAFGQDYGVDQTIEVPGRDVLLLHLAAPHPLGGYPALNLSYTPVPGDPGQVYAAGQSVAGTQRVQGVTVVSPHLDFRGGPGIQVATPSGSPLQGGDSGSPLLVHGQVVGIASDSNLSSAAYFAALSASAVTIEQYRAAASVSMTSSVIGQGSGRCLDDNGNPVNAQGLLINDCVPGAFGQQITYTARHELTLEGKCLGASSGLTAPGTQVILWDCTGGADQRWSINADGTITNQLSNLCLDVVRGGTGNGSGIDVYTCTRNSNQLWTMAPLAMRFVNSGTGRCLDDAGRPTNGQGETVYDCGASNANQLFEYVAGQQLTVAGKCLGASAGNTNPGTPVITWDCTGGADQRWSINPDGTITNRLSGLCLEVPAGSGANGSPIDLGTCNHGSNQHWVSNAFSMRLINAASSECLDDDSRPWDGAGQIIYPCGSGNLTQQYTYTAGHELTLSNGLCIAASNNGTAPGTPVIAWDCDAGAEQRWSLKADGTITNQLSGLCLESPSANAGSWIDLGKCSGAANQRWTLAPAPSLDNPAGTSTTLVG